MEIIKGEHRVKARKEHRCNFCSKVINIGEKHEVATYKHDDEIYTWRSCARCKPYVAEAFANKDYSWEDGMTTEDFYMYMREEHRDIAEKWWSK